MFYEMLRDQQRNDMEEYLEQERIKAEDERRGREEAMMHAINAWEERYNYKGSLEDRVGEFMQ